MWPWTSVAFHPSRFTVRRSNSSKTNSKSGVAAVHTLFCAPMGGKMQRAGTPCFFILLLLLCMLHILHRYTDSNCISLSLIHNSVYAVYVCIFIMCSGTSLIINSDILLTLALFFYCVLHLCGNSTIMARRR